MDGYYWATIEGDKPEIVEIVGDYLNVMWCDSALYRDGTGWKKTFYDTPSQVQIIEGPLDPATLALLRTTADAMRSAAQNMLTLAHQGTMLHEALAELSRAIAAYDTARDTVVGAAVGTAARSDNK